MDKVSLRCTLGGCQKEVSKFDDLEAHICERHLDYYRIECRICNQAFSNMHRFSTHWQKMHNDHATMAYHGLIEPQKHEALVNAILTSLGSQILEQSQMVQLFLGQFISFRESLATVPPPLKPTSTDRSNFPDKNATGEDTFVPSAVNVQSNTQRSNVLVENDNVENINYNDDDDDIEILGCVGCVPSTADGYVRCTACNALVPRDCIESHRAEHLKRMKKRKRSARTIIDSGDNNSMVEENRQDYSSQEDTQVAAPEPKRQLKKKVKKLCDRSVYLYFHAKTRVLKGLCFFILLPENCYRAVQGRMQDF